MGGTEDATARVGLLYGLAAYGLWGIVPIYFKAVAMIPAWEVLAHRIVWSAILLVALLVLFRRMPELLAALRDRWVFRRLVTSALLIGVNWYVFIYSVLNHRMLEGSLGYFILPMVNVAMGMVIFGERMKLTQWIALAFATVGVLVLVLRLGIFPWISLSLAFSFALYGVVRKHTPVDGTVGLTVETLCLAPIAVGFLVYWGWNSTLVFGQTDLETDVLIGFSGVVTTVPLICYVQAVRRLKLITIGFLQYLSPSLAFLLAVFCYGEPFTLIHQISFACIWTALLIFVWDAVARNRPQPPVILD